MAVDPFELLRALRASSPTILLESAKGGRYSLVAAGVAGERLRMDLDGGVIYTTADGVEHRLSGPPIALLRSVWNRTTLDGGSITDMFAGGGIGFFAYDFVRQVERLPSINPYRFSLPLFDFWFPHAFAVVDHTERVTLLTALVEDGSDDEVASSMLDRMAEGCERVIRSASTISADPVVDIASAGMEDLLAPIEIVPDRERFEKIVAQAVEYIHAGDVFQVNLSLRLLREWSGDPLELYRSLRSINPSPYMTLIELGETVIVGASPEQLLKVEGDRIASRPIAGTRRRGVDEAEDQQKIAELLGDEKERAEHLMLVDLERNDLGRVSRYGSVHVDEFMTVERYSHVLHIVSNVSGRLREECDLFDAIVALFPGGTITGAPKIRSMEIIEELEPECREIYTGSIGWIGYDGNAELNIAIRSILLKEGIASIQAGAGIVADSNPHFEYRESLKKATASLLALHQARRS
jgi:para-aminobenzoate synthetase component 1